MGGFQKSSRENFTKSEKKVELTTNSEAIHLLDFGVSSEEPEETMASDSPDLRIETFGGNLLKRENSTISSSRLERVETKEPLKPEHKNHVKEQAKTSIFPKRNPIFNDSLKIGFVFLAIAIGMAFFPALLQLMVLFAVVSMVFLFIGLKKLFNRRAKMKQKKLRKERNQERKDKIKEVFKK
jgi:hypothetical protein